MADRHECHSGSDSVKNRQGDGSRTRNPVEAHVPDGRAAKAALNVKSFAAPMLSVIRGHRKKSWFNIREYQKMSRRYKVSLLFFYYDKNF